MASLLERRLIILTGKGGTGKTTVACALGLVAARRGLHTIVVELGDQRRLAELFGVREGAVGEEVELQEHLWSLSIDPERVMIEWLQAITGRLPARVLASSSTFHYFTAAAPGARELAAMVKLAELSEGPYDVVVLDAPSTGHALALLRSPQTFSAIVRLGPLAERARSVRELLADPSRTAYAAVAHGTEMAVTETLELEEQLRRLLDRDLDVVFVNGILPRRFSREEIARVSALAQPVGDKAAGRASPQPGAESRKPIRDRLDARGEGVADAAVHAARALDVRVRQQQSQVARLRRQRFSDGAPPGVLTIPFKFTAQLDLAAIWEIAQRLGRRL